MSSLSKKLVLAGLFVAMTVVLGGCSESTVPSGDLPSPEGLSEETTQTSLYYSTGRSLLEERRVVDVNNPYEEILRELLLASPEENSDVAIVQPTADFNSVTLDGDMIVVDWAPGILDFEATDAEKRIALASFLATYGEFDNVDKVKFTVDGETEGSLDGKKIEDFWGAVSLSNQPWDVIRVSHSGSTTETVDPTGTGAESTE